MDQISTRKTAASHRREARLAKGYSLEDLAVATGLTLAELAAAQEPGAQVPENHLARIERALA
jgi:transcriptional regulator with XRE-family HTH domain